jgi:hypothetical protein
MNLTLKLDVSQDGETVIATPDDSCAGVLADNGMSDLVLSFTSSEPVKPTIVAVMYDIDV